MSTWLLDLLLVLSVYRLTRLLIVDEFPPIRIPREMLVAYLDPGEDHKAKYKWAKPRWGQLGDSIAYLIECPWCMSIWLGALVVKVATWFASVPAPVLVWLAASAITGLIATIESHSEQIYEKRGKS